MDVSRWAKSNKSSWRSKHFQANDRLFFRKNWTCRNRTTRRTQNSQFWVVHKHLFASCLLRNQENQPPKTNPLFTTAMRVLTHWLKQLHFWALKTSIRWDIRRIVLTGHRKTSFYSRRQRLKQLHYWALKTSILWVIRHIVLTWHRKTYFYSRT